MLLAPNGSANEAFKALQNKGRNALLAWVNAGGRYIGWRGGAALAAQTGLTTATLSRSSAGIPGSLIRARVDDGSPLAQGVGDFAYAFWEFDDIMEASPDDVVMRFPPHGTEDFFISGFADGEEELSDTAAVTDEAVGSGRVVLFTFDPNFRAFTDGTQKMLWNAILGPPPTTAPGLRAGSQERAAAKSDARRAARSVSDLQSPITIVVARSDAADTETLLGRFDARYEVRSRGARTTYSVANPHGFAADEHPYLRDLVVALRASNVKVVLFSAP